jgi:hypothetical protein
MNVVKWLQEGMELSDSRRKRKSSNSVTVNKEVKP